MVFPCIFTGEQDKEQEAESSLGIWRLKLEASQPSGFFRNRSCKIWLSHVISPLAISLICFLSKESGLVSFCPNLCSHNFLGLEGQGACPLGQESRYSPLENMHLDLFLVLRKLLLPCPGTVPCMCYLHVSDLGWGGSRFLEFPSSDLTQVTQETSNHSHGNLSIRISMVKLPMLFLYVTWFLVLFSSLRS